jgi:hypothetical protein
MPYKIRDLPDWQLLKMAQEILQHLTHKGNAEATDLLARFTPKPPEANQTPTYPFKFHTGQYVRHVKSGGIYSVVGLPSAYRLEATGEPAYAYMANGTIWVRGQAAFEDGRFEPAYDEALEHSRPPIEIGRFSSGRFGQEGLRELRLTKEMEQGFGIIQFGDENVVELGVKTAPEVRAEEQALRRYPGLLTQSPDHYLSEPERRAPALQTFAGVNGTSN